MAEETILILDEDKNARWPLKTFLESEGYNVVIADSVEKVLGDFREFRVSALITDYRVGHDRTREAITVLKRIWPNSYVMMVTEVEVKEEEYADLIHRGVDDYFLKPVSAAKILLHLKKGMAYRAHPPDKREIVRARTFIP